jgi:hypothetical protein
MSANNKIKINMDSLKTRRDWKRHKVKDGNNIFRILPPFGEDSNGYPYKKWQIIWGLQDPESGRSRPFASSMTSEKKCPITEYVAVLKKKAESLKSQLATSGLSEEEIKENLSPLNKLISDLNPKTVYIYNAADRAGEVGLLELKSTAQKKMKAEMTAYIKDYNQDPTSLNSEDTDSGVWFNIIRTGEGRDTEYDVKKFQTKIKNASGKISFEDDRSPLADSIVENYDNLAYDLNAVYQVKSYDELAEILEANMSSLVELCPEADISQETQSVVVAPKPTQRETFVSKPVGKKPVTLKMDDDEDMEQAPIVAKSSKGSQTTKVQPDIDLGDDFEAMAASLLN